MDTFPFSWGLTLSPFGLAADAWKDRPGKASLSFHHLLAQVLQAEQSGMDYILLPDALGARPEKTLIPGNALFEPTTLATALASRTTSIGFLAAASIAQHEPYNLARRFASMDHISAGRSGWMVLGAGQETGRDSEYVAVVRSLWDSWDDDAFVYDKARGRFFEPEKMHVLNHKGENFSVRGPLNVNRSPQGQPILAASLTAEVTGGYMSSVDVVFVGSTEKMELIVSLGAARRKSPAARVVANIIPAFDRLEADVEVGVDFKGLGGLVAAGNAATVADVVINLLETGAADGINILPPTLVDGRRFLVEVLPLLRDHGLAPGQAPRGRTLRQALSLPYPSLQGRNES